MSGDRAAPSVSWDALVAMTPQVIREALPMLPWDVRKLHDLHRPVRRVAIAELQWLFDLPLWQLHGHRFQITPRQVREDPASFPDHVRRVMMSDLRYPIHVVEYRERLVVLDGFHRLLKAAIEDRREVDAVELSLPDLESICPP